MGFGSPKSFDMGRFTPTSFHSLFFYRISTRKKKKENKNNVKTKRKKNEKKINEKEK